MKERAGPFSEPQFINRIPHRRRIENVVHGVPGVTTKPVRTKDKTSLLGLQLSHLRPGLTSVLRHKNAILAYHHHRLFIVTEERPLPDTHSRSMRLPTRAFILAHDQASRTPQIMRAVKKDWNPGLRIGWRNVRPGGPGIRAAIDAVAFAVNECHRIQGSDH